MRVFILIFTYGLNVVFCLPPQFFEEECFDLSSYFQFFEIQIKPLVSQILTVKVQNAQSLFEY